MKLPKNNNSILSSMVYFKTPNIPKYHTFTNFNIYNSKLYKISNTETLAHYLQHTACKGNVKFTISRQNTLL